MEYTVKLNEFDGPLDLLLHLIKKANINIWDIEIEAITKQYLDYIHQAKNLDLTASSEYLVMAAELIEMKSKSLLPAPEIEEEEEDPRENLIKRLIDYSRYKEVSESFKVLESERKKIYTKEPSLLEEYMKEDILEEGIGLEELLKAFQNVLEKRVLEQPLSTKITEKEYSMEERNKEICSLLKKKSRVPFSELFTFYHKDYIVVTFLSILDLTKKGLINMEQSSNFDEIILIDSNEVNYE